MGLCPGRAVGCVLGRHRAVAGGGSGLFPGWAVGCVLGGHRAVSWAGSGLCPGRPGARWRTSRLGWGAAQTVGDDCSGASPCCRETALTTNEASAVPAASPEVTANTTPTGVTWTCPRGTAGPKSSPTPSSWGLSRGSAPQPALAEHGLGGRTGRRVSPWGTSGVSTAHPTPQAEHGPHIRCLRQCECAQCIVCVCNV